MNLAMMQLGHKQSYLLCVLDDILFEWPLLGCFWVAVALARV